MWGYYKILFSSRDAAESYHAAEAVDAGQDVEALDDAERRRQPPPPARDEIFFYAGGGHSLIIRSVRVGGVVIFPNKWGKFKYTARARRGCSMFVGFTVAGRAYGPCA